MTATLNIQPVTASDAQQISAMLVRQPDSYTQYFRPFDFGFESIRERISKANKDIYMGIFWETGLIGFFFCAAGMKAMTSPPMGLSSIRHFRGAAWV